MRNKKFALAFAKCPIQLQLMYCQSTPARRHVQHTSLSETCSGGCMLYICMHAQKTFCHKCSRNPAIQSCLDRVFRDKLRVQGSIACQLNLKHIMPDSLTNRRNRFIFHRAARASCAVVHAESVRRGCELLVFVTIVPMVPFSGIPVRNQSHHIISELNLYQLFQNFHHN